MRKYVACENTFLLRELLLTVLWNSLPSYIVNSFSVNSFKADTDKCRRSQDVYYDCKCDIAGTENSSNSNK